MKGHSMRLTNAITTIALLIAFLLPAPARGQITFGRKKPVTDKTKEAASELGLDRNKDALSFEKGLAAKVHTVAILTIAGSPKASIGIKSTDAMPLLAHAEMKLVSLLTAAGYTVQPLDKTRETVK